MVGDHPLSCFSSRRHAGADLRSVEGFYRRCRARTFRGHRRHTLAPDSVLVADCSRSGRWRHHGCRDRSGTFPGSARLLHIARSRGTALVCFWNGIASLFIRVERNDEADFTAHHAEMAAAPERRREDARLRDARRQTTRARLVSSAHRFRFATLEPTGPARYHNTRWIMERRIEEGAAAAQL